MSRSILNLHRRGGGTRKTPGPPPPDLFLGVLDTLKGGIGLWSLFELRVIVRVLRNKDGRAVGNVGHFVYLCSR